MAVDVGLGIDGMSSCGGMPGDTQPGEAIR
jgi:hypothetical protein